MPSATTAAAGGLGYLDDDEAKKKSRGPRKEMSARQKKQVLYCASCLAVVLLFLKIFSPVTLDTTVQCFFKAYFPIDDYTKSGAKFTSVSDVLKAHGGGGFSSNSLPTDKGTDHSYNTVYDAIFPVYKDGAAPVSLLEIGVKKGGGIKLFREYFPFSARIYGSDIDPTISSFPKDIGIKTVVLDSTVQANVVRSFGREKLFDIIVDDGCHFLECIKNTFRNFWPLLTARGVFVVEDFPAYYLDPENVADWSPDKMFPALASNIKQICVQKDTGFAGEFIVVIYPTGSVAPLLPGCQSIWHEKK